MSSTSDRLARIIETDAGGEIKRTMRVAQSDIMALLSEFMDVTRLDMTVNKCDDGFELAIIAKAARIKSVGNVTGND